MARMRRMAANVERIARAEAEAARQQVSDILESISDAFMALDHQWRYVYVNQEALKQTRKSAPEIIGQVIWEVFPDLVGSNFYTEYHRAVQEQTPVTFEEYYAPFDTWYEVHAYPSQNGLSVYFQDITPRKRMEKELRQQSEHLIRANRMKDEFLATVSHELRTPLNSILGWTQILRRGGLRDDAVRRALETVERNARLQNQLIEDLLDVSRIISGKLRLDVRPIELTSVIEAAIDTVRPAAQAKSIRLTSILDPKAGLVAGDANRLQQVVWNLLSNAIKFTPKGGRVQVQLERVNSHVEIIVSDTGQGINVELLPYIFERFRQADSTTTRQYSGLGLGLAIVRHLVELHGGTIWASSPGEGLGAVFTVHLPLRAVRDEDNSKERVHPTVEDAVAFDYSPKLLDGLQVLVVDDEPDARELVRFVLEQHGAEVMTVASVSEAIEAFEVWRPNVLLSDIGMPGEDGYDLIRKVKALEQKLGIRTPAAALTAYARAEDRTRSLAMGYQLHLPKPIDPSELVTVVANLAGRTISLI